MHSVTAPLDVRLAVVIGKGGAGRTTVAATMALSAARRGRRVLLCEIHGRDRATRLLGHAPIAEVCREVRPRLWIANVTPEAAFEEYVIGVVRSRRLYRHIFGGEGVKAFLRGLPGLDDIMMIGKIRFLVEEGSRWDMVIVDAPATGNGLYFLEGPEALLRAVRSGPLGHYARKQRALLRDAARTAVHIVTLAEEMPVVESLELARALTELGMPLGAAVINRVRPELFDRRSRELLSSLAGARTDADIARLVAVGRWALGRWELQEQYRRELRQRLRVPCLELPELSGADLGPVAMERLADALDAQLAPSSIRRRTDAAPTP